MIDSYRRGRRDGDSPSWWPRPCKSLVGTRVMGRRTRARDGERGEALTDVRGVRRPRIFEPAHVFSIGTAGDSTHAAAGMVVTRRRRAISQAWTTNSAPPVAV